MKFLYQWHFFGYVWIFLLGYGEVVGAFFPVADSGRLLYRERQEIAVHSHFVFAEKGLDFNVLAHFDELLGKRKDTNIRYVLGFGWSGLALGSFIKWVPFPDYKYQPAMGVSAGALYHPSSTKTHYISLILRPLISKDISTIIGKFTPYLALPLSVQVKNLTQFDFPIRLAVGLRGELFFIHFHKIDLNLELGLSLTSQGSAYFNVGFITDLIL